MEADSGMKSPEVDTGEVASGPFPNTCSAHVFTTAEPEAICSETVPKLFPQLPIRGPERPIMSRSLPF